MLNCHLTKIESTCVYHNATWKVCRYAIHALVGLYQKSYSFAALTRSISDTTNSCVNTRRKHFPLSIQYVFKI